MASKMLDQNINNYLNDILIRDINKKKSTIACT